MKPITLRSVVRMALKKYPVGAIIDPPDPRDYSVQVSAAPLPKRAFLPNLPKHRDQEAGNCVAQAFRTVSEMFWRIVFGVNWLYGGARTEKDKTPGLNVHRALQFWHDYGMAPEKDDPGEKEVPSVISYVKREVDRLKKSAEPYKGITYAKAANKEEVKAAIVAGLPVVLTAKIETYKTDTFGWFKCRKASKGLHEMFIAGYDDEVLYTATKTREGCFVRNSWGDDWGLSGDCWMTWEDVFALSYVYVIFPPEAPPEPIKPRRTLRKGMSGEDVLEAQKKLLAHGFFRDEPKGNFGPKTYEAAVTFQKAKGLVADGIIGKNTWTALDADPFIDPVYPDRILEFVEYLKSRVGDIYVWGAQGESDITEKWIKSREKLATNQKRAIALWEKRVKAGKVDLRAFDCSGLIMYWLQDTKGWFEKDLSANSIYRKCTKLTRDQLKAGDLVFRHNKLKAYHVGIYVGDGKVIEAKGRDDGVVMRDIDASGGSYWNKCGRLGVLQA